MSLSKSKGPEMYRLSINECKKLLNIEYNFSDVDDILYIPSNASVVSTDVTNALSQKAKELGSSIIENCQVKSFELTNTKGMKTISKVNTDQGSIIADIIVLCGGLWSKNLAQLAGTDICCWPSEHMNCTTEAFDVARTFPTIRDPDH